MLGLKSIRTASITLAGIELAHRIRKRQFSIFDGNPVSRPSPKQLWEQALARPCPDVWGRELALGGT